MRRSLKSIILIVMIGVCVMPGRVAFSQPATKTVNPEPAFTIAKAEEFFNSAQTMVSDFVQITNDGRRFEGKLSIQKPGKLRFEYARPATLEIVADGTSVAVRDRKLATQDVYFISQTPLKFLLKPRTDLSKDVRVLEVINSNNVVSILVEDKATFGGTSRIRLFFDPVSYALKQWSIVDPQGYETLVTLSNLDLKTKPDPALFVINYERFDR